MSNRFWDLFRDGLWTVLVVLVVLLLTCRLQATVRWPHKRFWPSFWCNMRLIASNYLHVAFKVFWIRQYQMSLAELQFLSPSKDARLINAPYICCIDKNLRCLQEFLRNQTVQLPDSESVRGTDGGKALKKHRHGVILSQHHSFFEVAEKVKSMKSEVGKVIRWLLICFLLVNVFLVYFGVIDWNALCQDQPLYVDVLCVFFYVYATVVWSVYVWYLYDYLLACIFTVTLYQFLVLRWSPASLAAIFFCILTLSGASSNPTGGGVLCPLRLGIRREAEDLRTTCSCGDLCGALSVTQTRKSMLWYFVVWYVNMS